MSTLYNGYWLSTIKINNANNAIIYDSKGVTDNPIIRRSIAKLLPNDTNIVHVEFNPCHQQRNDIDNN